MGQRSTNPDTKMYSVKKILLWLLLIAVPSAAYYAITGGARGQYDYAFFALVIAGASVAVERKRLRQFGLSLDSWSARLCGLAAVLAVVPFVALLVLGLGAGAIPTARVDAPPAYLIVLTINFIVSSAIIEEFAMRGIVFQEMEKWMPRPLLSIASSLIFVAMHSMNPNIGAIALVNVFLANILLNIIFFLSRSLLAALAYHFVWNFSQVLLLGAPLSGNHYEPILYRVSIDQLNPIIFGSEFGFEGGIACSFVLIITAAIVAKKVSTSPVVSALIYKEQYGKID